MRVVLQRVSKASVTVDKAEVGAIANGILILVGFEHDDTGEDIVWMANKICNLRIFDDQDDVMNLSIVDVKGDLLVVSQFTHHAKTKKGNRPSYIKAAHPDLAIPLYNHFIQELKQVSKLTVNEGVFGAKMGVSLENNGPVTILIDTKNKE